MCVCVRAPVYVHVCLRARHCPAALHTVCVQGETLGSAMFGICAASLLVSMFSLRKSQLLSLLHPPPQMTAGC